VSWNDAIHRIRDEAFLDGIPRDVDVALSSVLSGGGEFYRTVKCLPDVAANAAAEYLAIAMECAVTAVILHRETVTAHDWSAASRLLLGDGLLALAFNIASRHQNIDCVRFSALIGQLAGEKEPANLIRKLIEQERIGILLNDTTITTRTEDLG
jgi:hypothetical protein